MKLFDLQGDKVTIHTEALAIPCFRAIWESEKDKSIARDYITYIVLKNHPDSPYVKAMYEEERAEKLKLKLFNKDWTPNELTIEAEKEYIEFLDTLNLKLLRGFRNRLEAMSKYMNSKDDHGMDMRMAKDTLAVAGMLEKAIKSIDTLEKQVKRDEIESSRVRGGGDIGMYELPNRR
jgi:hypothetical protein